MQDADVAYRESLYEQELEPEVYLQKIEELTSAHGRRLLSIINRYGWPGNDAVDFEAADAAWYIAQNAMGVPEVMRTALIHLQKAVEIKQAPAWQLAYLEDAVHFYSGQPQRYGTQFDWTPEGNMEVYQLLDNEAETDKRRKAVGLNSLKARRKEILLELIDAGEEAPTDFQTRKKAFQAWQKKRGWL